MTGIRRSASGTTILPGLKGDNGADGAERPLFAEGSAYPATWPGSNRPASRMSMQEGSRPTSSVSKRPGSVQRATSAASTNRPASRISNMSMQASSRPTSSMSKAASEAQLRKGLAKLPPLPATPLTFEDIYAMAKRRASHKLFETRKAAKPKIVPLADVDDLAILVKERLETSGIRPSSKASSNRGGSRPGTAGGQAPKKTVKDEQDEWASSALQVMNEVEKKRPNSVHGEGQQVKFEGDTQDIESAGDHGEETALALQTQSPSRPSSARASPNETASEKLSGQMRERGSLLSKVSGASLRSTRQGSRTAALSYISTMRKAINSHSSASANNELDSLMLDTYSSSDNAQDFSRQISEGFSDEELDRMRIAFRRFKTSEGTEIHVDDLKEALSHLGYLKYDNPKVIEEMVSTISRFSTLDWQEFVDFMEKFAAWEKQQYRLIFDRLDENKSGTLSMDETKALLIEMGITPLNATLEEAKTVVDFDGSGEFDFDEFMHLMSVYKVSEGFTRAEVKRLREVFDRVATPAATGSEKEIRPRSLQDALAHMFGPQAADLAKKFAKKLQVAGGGLGSDDEGEDDYDPASASGLHFPEFLVWARHLREEEIAEYEVQFKKFDVDHTGCLASDELRNVIHALGYMPLWKMVSEVLDTCDIDKSGMVEFEEFVNLMAVFRATDGFNKDEVDEFEAVFDQYKKPDEEQVSCLELMDILRSLGYVTNFDEVRRYTKEVDFDNSNSLGFCEFLRLMRLHREAELSEIKDVYLCHKVQGKERMERDSLMVALKELGYSPNEEVIEKAVDAMGDSKKLDFDAFVSIVDQARKLCMEARVKQAGFSDEEIKKYQNAFAVYDEDGNGDIEKHELTKLLKDLNIPMGTVNDQKGMLVKLDEARQAARKAGVEDELIGKMGDPAVTFHTLLHLVRRVLSADDKAEVDRETQVMQKLNFNAKELSEFREVFEYWAHQPGCGKEKRDSGDDDAQVVALKNDDPVYVLRSDGVRRVVRSLGLQLTSAQKVDLDDKVKEYADNQGDTGFPEFLTLMRWMLDTNFGGLGDATAAYT